MADARDLQKSVGNGDGAWFATQDGDGRGRARDDDGQVVAVGAAEPTDGVMVETAQFVPTVYLYDNFPGGVGLSEPLWQRKGALVQGARELVAACDCSAGCPPCVGPVLAIAEDQTPGTPKRPALRVLAGGAEARKTGGEGM